MNNSGKEKVLDSLQVLGKRYVRDYLNQEGWDEERLKNDWFHSLEFLIQHLYYQGRRDELSTRFFECVWRCVEEIFLPEPTPVFESLWDSKFIPHDAGWHEYVEDDNPLWERVNSSTMGKTRDREMVLDCLRYVHGIDQYNVVKASLAAIEGGDLGDHRQDLMDIWGVGGKTSAFYLRDLVLLFGMKVMPSVFLDLQPIDTWVAQVVQAVTGQSMNYEQVEQWINSQTEHHDVALLNAGAWYLGKNAFRVALTLVGQGELTEDLLEKMELLKFDG